MSKSLQDTFERLQGVQVAAEDELRGFLGGINNDTHLDLAHVEGSHATLKEVVNWFERQRNLESITDFKDYLKRREEDIRNAIDGWKYRLAQYEGMLATIQDIRELQHKTDKNYKREAQKIVRRAATRSKKIGKFQIL